MIVVDTSVWVLGGADIARVLGGVARISAAGHEEVVRFIERQGGPVRRIGWVDAHIVCAALAGGFDLLTYDRHQAEFFGSARW